MTTRNSSAETAPAATRAAGAMAGAEQLLHAIRSRASTAEAEATVQHGTSALTRFANGFVHQNVAEELSHVLVRVALDRQVATARLDGPTDPDSLGRLADRVLEAARVRPADPEWPGLTPPAPPPAVDHWDDATALATPDDRAAIVAAFIAASRGLETAGACSTDAVVAAYANTEGQQLAGRTTWASLDGIARTATSDGSGRHASVSVGDIDGRLVGERAARKARDGEGAEDIEPGRYEVILEPQAVANVLQFLFVYGFNGRPVEEGRSFVRIGDAQFDPSVTLRDDVTDAGTVGLAFDAEGTPKRSVNVVSAGVTRGVLHTRRTALAAGTDSTGNAVEGGEQWGALPGNPVLDAGVASDAELIAGVERGLLVTDFWYTRILDPRTQVVTGLTRNGVWLIEEGRIARPVSNLRFTQSFVEALGPGQVRAVSAARALVPGGMESFHLVPSLHLASWNFTGGAKG
jgi:predicted Zn-dependent protease